MTNKYKITLKEVKEAFSNPAEIKGIALKEGFFSAVKEKIGEIGLKQVEEELKNFGFFIKVEEIENFKWYPAGILIAVYFILQEKFNFQESDFAEMAEFSVKLSPIIKFWMRYFVEPQKILEISAPRLWKRYYRPGKIETWDFQDSEKGGHYFIRIKDFKLHPLHFFYLGHYFVTIQKTVKNFKEIKFEETKSPFRYDEYQEYLIEWKY